MKKDARPSRFYRLLLRLLPGEVRARFGADMEQLYHEQLAELGSASARARYRLAATGDVVGTACAEWMTIMRESAGTGGGMTMDGGRQDLGFGVRTLMRRPGFTMAAVLTLALGIGATVSIFTVVNGVLLDPLPYPDSDRLVVLWSRNTEDGTRGRGVDHPDVVRLPASGDFWVVFDNQITGSLHK